MKKFLTIAAATALLGAGIYAEPAKANGVLPYMGGSCPDGYRNDGNRYCVDMGGAKPAFVKRGSFCPSGYTAWGLHYCLGM